MTYYPFINTRIREEYTNHLAAVDNFTQTAVASSSGSATVTLSNTASPIMFLSTGTSAADSAIFQSKDTYTLGVKPIVMNFVVQDHQDGVGNTRRTYMGLKADFTTDASKMVCIVVDGATTYARTYDSSQTSVSVTSIAAGDVWTIEATTSYVNFYRNGTLETTITTQIPTTTVSFGVVVSVTGGASSTARILKLEEMSIKVYR